MPELLSATCESGFPFARVVIGVVDRVLVMEVLVLVAVVVEVVVVVVVVVLGVVVRVLVVVMVVGRDRGESGGK